MRKDDEEGMVCPLERTCGLGEHGCSLEMDGSMEGSGKMIRVMLQWCEQPKVDIVFNTMHQGMRNQDNNVSSM